MPFRDTGLEHLGFTHREADPQGQQAEERGDDEGHAPAPVGQCGVAAHRGQDEAQEEGHQGSGIDREPLPGAGEGTAIGWRRLDQEGRSRAELAARREALHQPRQHQDDGGGDADALVVRADTDDEGSHRHQQDGQGQALLAAITVGEGAEHRTADGPHEETDSEHRQHRKQGREAVSGRKELFRKNRRKGRVDHPVGVLDYGAERGGHYRLLLRVGQLAPFGGRAADGVGVRHETTDRTIVVIHRIAPVSTVLVVYHPKAFTSG
ncbi:hypothetical protein FQZ97_803490 [compost metagenome]